MARQVRYFPANGAPPVVLNGPQREPGVRLHRGAKGLGLPPVDAVSEEVAGSDGEFFIGAKYGARTITFPATIAGSSRADYRARLRALEASFHAHDGPGELEISEDGGARRVRCLYVGGLEGDEARGEHGMKWWRTVLEFHAFDPYFRDSNPYREAWQQADAVPFFSSPWLPVRLSSSRTLGDTYLVNDGDGDAWPSWTVTGPFDVLTILNRTTGEKFVINGPLAAGRTVTIVTEPESCDIVATGPVENWWSHLTTSSTLWAARPGWNFITLTATNSTAATKVEVAFARRYRSAS